MGICNVKGTYMKKDVIIKILDEQLSDGDRDKTELTTRGVLSKLKSRYSIEYDELDEELAGSRTKLTVDSPTCVTMHRAGTYNSDFVVEQNKRHSCYYDTPMGGFTMGVYGRLVCSSLGDRGGILRMDYTIDFNTGLAAENSLTITVEELRS